jgi:hypothetical protein
MPRLNSTADIMAVITVTPDRAHVVSPCIRMNAWENLMQRRGRLMTNEHRARLSPVRPVAPRPAAPRPQLDDMPPREPGRGAGFLAAVMAALVFAMIVADAPAKVAATVIEAEERAALRAGGW